MKHRVPQDNQNFADDPLDRYRKAFDPPWWRNIDFWYAAFLFALLAAGIAWVIIHSGNQVAL